MTALEHRTNRLLRLTARLHRLPFNTKQPTQHERQRLYTLLLERRCLRRAWRQLTAEDKAGLRALQAAGGRLPFSQFTAAFGQIRRFRPWLAAQDYRYPVSSAEKLWFLAFIEIDKRRQWVVISDEVRAILPPLPLPAPQPQRLASQADSPATMLRDLAIFLGSFLYMEVKPRWGRWLPPTALRVMSERLGLTPTPSTGRVREGIMRSELQTGRLRWLHYLAEVAGLVAGHTLQPAAWQWLSLAPAQQWEHLWGAWGADMQRPEGLWRTYRLPDMPWWAALVHILGQLPPGQAVKVTDLAAALRPYLPPPAFETALAEGLTLLAWSGYITLAGDHLAVQSIQWTPPSPAHLTLTPEQFWLDLPTLPILPALVAALAWLTHTLQGWCVDAAAVKKAVSQGKTASEIGTTLALLTGQPLPPEAFAQLQGWEQQAHGLLLRQVTLLTSPDPAKLARLRHDRTLRWYFEGALAPQHVLVRGGLADKLLQRLARRKITVTCERPLSPPAKTPAAYLWLAMRVYQHLGQLIPLKIHLPAAVADDLALEPAQRVGLEQAAQEVMERLRYALDGKLSLPPPVAQDDPAAIRQALERAYQERRAVTIEYLSPTQGYPVQRTIEPRQPLTQQDGAWYLSAWCRLAADERTFRLDRILRILSLEDAAAIDIPF